MRKQERLPPHPPQRKKQKVLDKKEKKNIEMLGKKGKGLERYRAY